MCIYSTDKRRKTNVRKNTKYSESGGGVGTVLYSDVSKINNSIGTTGFTETLANLSNYNLVEIFFLDGGNPPTYILHSERFPRLDGKTNSYKLSYMYDNGTLIMIRPFTINWSTGEITFSNGGCYATADGSSYLPDFFKYRCIPIKIIGYKV